MRSILPSYLAGTMKNFSLCLGSAEEPNVAMSGHLLASPICLLGCIDRIEKQFYGAHDTPPSASFARFQVPLPNTVQLAITAAFLWESKLLTIEVLL